MSLKIAFYLENRDITGVNLTQPQNGNPGCGGTEYLFVAVPYYLNKKQNNKITSFIIANDIDLLPDEIEKHQAQNVYDAAKLAKENGTDIFVYRPRRNIEEDILDLIDELELPTIGWAHITPQHRYIRKMTKSPYFKSLLCVEQEQCDQIQDTPIYNKLSFIVNGFDVDNFALDNPPDKDPKLVTYLGALVKQKGFHLLAKIWLEVIKQVPDAKLSVIGTGNLYGESVMGSLSIAEKSYEEKYIIPYLSDENGKIHSSVTFHGKMGLEKKDILYKSSIGVPNPTGASENCPGSSIEFSACGTAIVSGAYQGILDTVDDGKTGLLGTSEKDLINNICCLLKDHEKAKQMGQAGIKFIELKYNWDIVSEEWLELFTAISENKNVPKRRIKRNFLKHYKFLIMPNCLIQRLFGKFFFWPSVNEVKYYILSLLRKNK